MTIKVTVAHAQPGYPTSIEVRTLQSGELGVPQEIKPGASAEFWVHSGQKLLVSELDTTVSEG